MLEYLYNFMYDSTTFVSSMIFFGFVATAIFFWKVIVEDE